MMIFTAIGKFVAFMFRKTHYETVVADIFGIGIFIRNCSLGKTLGETQFYPAIALQQELRLSKMPPAQLKEPTQRQELSLTRLAQVCSLSEGMTHVILQAICKSIVSSQGCSSQGRIELASLSDSLT